MKFQDIKSLSQEELRQFFQIKPNSKEAARQKQKGQWKRLK
jgi:hypothetical protein